MKTDLFQSCGHCWVFQICWHTECSTFTVSSFRIWNSSTGIPSPPLALFIVMLLEAHLTSHYRMSGSRWLITPLWLTESWISFLYSSVYSCHLFYHWCGVDSCHHPTISVLYWAHLCMKCSTGISFSWRDLWSFPFYCFSLFLCIDHWGRLSYLSLLFLELCIQVGLSCLFSFAFCFPSFHSYL